MRFRALRFQGDTRNLEITVEWMGGEPQEAYAEIFVDGRPLGNVSRHRPVLYLRKGEHKIEVRSPGFALWTKTLFVVGEPNHQFLHVVLYKADESP